MSEGNELTERAVALRRESYKDPRKRARVVRILLGIWVVASAAIAAHAITTMRARNRLQTNPLSITFEEIETMLARETQLIRIGLVAMLVTAIFFIGWLLRVHDSTSAIGLARPRHGRGWAIGGWFVPILNWWRPKQIMNDLWKISDPEQPPEARRFEDNKVSPVVHLWWALWLVQSVVKTVLANMLTADPSDALLWSLVVVNLAWVVLSVVAYHLVGRLTDRVVHRFDGTPVENEQPFGAILAGVLALGGFTFGFAPALLDVDDDVESKLINDIEIGDCWSTPELATGELTTIVGVEITECDSPHDAEVYTQSRFTALGAVFPGEEELFVLALPHCVAEFEESFGVSFESSPLDLVPVVPIQSSWIAGDRKYTCSVATFFEGKLERPADEYSSTEGVDLGIEDISTCDELGEATALTIVDLVVVFEGMTPDEQFELSLTGQSESMIRTIKREALLSIKQFELECDLDVLDEIVASELADVTAETPEGQQIIDSFIFGGYWVPSDV